MPKSLTGVEPSKTPTLPPATHQAGASAKPTFTRSHSSSSYSDSDPEDSSPKVEVYRGFCATEGDSVAQWSLSQHGMSLMIDGGLPPDRALIESRKKARAILADTSEAGRCMGQHMVNSHDNVFPMGHGQPPGRSPFMSVTDKRSTADMFAISRPKTATGRPQPTVVTYSVRSSKLISNPYNSTEREFLAPGGLHPRHIVSIDWPDTPALTTFNQR